MATPEEEKAWQKARQQETERQERQKILDDTPNWKRTLFNIPIRPLNARERAEQLLLKKTEYDYLKGKVGSFDKLVAELGPAQPAAGEDPLDRVRVMTTLIMVAALFAIVAVIVFKKNPPSSLNQLISLASGLAGIGLGWLFGAATTRASAGRPPRPGRQRQSPPAARQGEDE